VNGFFGMDITMDFAWTLQPGLITESPKEANSGEIFREDFAP